MLRVFRIAKIGRHNENLRILIRTMYASGGEIAFMASLLSLSIIIFSTLCYLGNSKICQLKSIFFIFLNFLVESSDEKSEFSSIPSTIWWSCITLTTVGYGDVIPQTPLGKVIAIGKYHFGSRIKIKTINSLCLHWNSRIRAASSSNH